VLHKGCGIGNLHRTSPTGRTLCLHGPDLCRCRIRFPSKCLMRDEAARADWTRAPRSHLDPLRVLPDPCLPAESRCPGSRREVPCGGEDRHVGADLGEDDLGGAAVDTGDCGQQLNVGDERD